MPDVINHLSSQGWRMSTIQALTTDFWRCVQSWPKYKDFTPEMLVAKAKENKMKRSPSSKYL
jgi:hypothetical protein